MNQTPAQKFLDKSCECKIALDGTSASGKGTLAKLIEHQYGFFYCQSSIFYRSLAFKFLNQHYNIEEFAEPEKKDYILKQAELLNDYNIILANINDQDLYSDAVTRMSSIIAAIPEVRESLLKPQRDFLKNHNRVIMEGRDIGTVIAPDADIKIFITADVEVRAKRRYDQMVASKKDVSYDDVLASLKERDNRDQGRVTAPLKKADGAIEIDTTDITIEEVHKILLNEIRKL